MASPLSSMTGFGAGEGSVKPGRVVVELRTVNHRFLDIRLRLAPALSELAPVVEERLRARLRRGRVELSARFEGDAEQPVTLHKRRARAAYEQLAALRDELRPEEPVPLSLLSTVPDLFTESVTPPRDALTAALRKAVDMACDATRAMRQREGVALTKDLESRVAAARKHVVDLQARAPEAVHEYRRRLRERISQLLEDVNIATDAGRLEHEVAVFADRVDIAEELTRIDSHLDQFLELLAAGGDSVGRRLEFLLQELGREANTIGAKSSDVASTRLVVELKAEIERMREQVQNVE